MEQDLSSVGTELSRDEPQQCGFAGTARSHHGRDTAARDREVQSGKDGAIANRVVDIADLDDVIGGCGSRHLGLRDFRLHHTALLFAFLSGGRRRLTPPPAQAWPYSFRSARDWSVEHDVRKLSDLR